MCSIGVGLRTAVGERAAVLDFTHTLGRIMISDLEYIGKIFSQTMLIMSEYFKLENILGLETASWLPVW